MKKVIIIGIAVAIAMGFTACQKENLSEEQEGGLIKETFAASFEHPSTRTSTADGGATVTWAANDKVHYYTVDGGTVRNCTISSAAASATLTLERETSDTYYNLVYTGSTAPTFTTKTGSSMVFDGVRTAQDGTFAGANVSVGRTTPGGSGITFKPVTALVKFTTARTDIKTVVLTGGVGTESVAGSVSVDPTAASPIASLSGTGSTGITVTIGTPAAGTYYINVLPVTYSSGLVLTLKDAGSNTIGTVTASKSIDLSAGGKIINLGNIDSHIVEPATDLCKDGTANCYIVSEAGTYKFKAVKGNSTTSVGTVASAAVLWESYGTSTAPSVGDLIKSDVSYADNCIIFTTGSKFPTEKGNAVIAAKDASGNVLWSWHIWLADKPADQVYVNSAGTMMDRNLGATSATKGAGGALGLLYQWGRKDPFLAYSHSKSGTDYTAASTLSWPDAQYVSDHLSGNNNTLEYSIANPTTFIKSFKSPLDWYCSDMTYFNNNLWKNASGNAKTIYDPCPVGYRVPEGGDEGVWKTAGITMFGTFDTTNNGVDYSSYVTPSATCWYPFTLCRKAEYAFNMGYAYYWSCTCDTTGINVYNLKIASGFGGISSTNTTNRAAGCLVRCLKE